MERIGKSFNIGISVLKNLIDCGNKFNATFFFPRLSMTLSAKASFFFLIDKLKFYQKKNQKMMKLANQRAEPIIRKDERPPKFYLVCVIECKRKEI